MDCGLKDTKLDPYRDDNYFSNEKRLERITGVKFNVKKVIDFEKSTYRSLSGGYDAETTILLKKQPDYHVLDSLVRMNEWTRTEEGYSFHRIWGNGLEPPKGEDKDEDRFITVEVVPNSDTLYIQSGVW